MNTEKPPGIDDMVNDLIDDIDDAMLVIEDHLNPPSMGKKIVCTIGNTWNRALLWLGIRKEPGLTMEQIERFTDVTLRQAAGRKWSDISLPPKDN